MEAFLEASCRISPYFLEVCLPISANEVACENVCCPPSVPTNCQQSSLLPLSQQAAANTLCHSAELLFSVLSFWGVSEARGRFVTSVDVSAGNSGLVEVKVYDPIPAALSASSSVYELVFLCIRLTELCFSWDFGEKRK
ncbi:hypothetical protein P5673_001925 [Acropora cervicornis]|uniref:Uncharacterized protein n=1 Tax=Acropora cervicornis TaxID=6130 RepID=A0AAD9VFQ9_ACRCE|nr:hypothetical protein P5673_001925 [Acropora cervicornis]